MAKTIPFNIRLKIDGKDVVVSCRKDVEKLGEALTASQQKTSAFRNAMMEVNAVTGAFSNAYASVQNLTNIMSPYIEKANAAADAQTRLTTVMRQRMAATSEDVASINAAVAAQSQLGVVGGTVQRMGLQQLATFASHKSTLTALLPAMNNLLTQQKGLNATGQDAVGIANLLGKALQGQTSALRRVGITFSDAQAKAIQAGTEGERAALIAEIITQNVGNMNAELAKTDAGKAKQLANSFGGALAKIGASLAPYQGLIAQFGQMGMAATGVIQFGSALKGVGVAIQQLGVRCTASVAGLRLWRASALGASAVCTVLHAKLTGAAVGATTLRVALTALQTATVVGIALTALAAIMGSLYLASQNTAASMDAQALAMQHSKERAESLAKAMKEATEQVKDSRAQLLQDIATTKDWHGTKAKEKALVEQLNGRYGETMGYFSSVAQWYTALTANSEAYCQQLINEARMRVLANQAADLQQQRYDLTHDDKGKPKRYSTRREMKAVVAGHDEEGNPNYELRYAPSDFQKARAELAGLRQQENAVRRQMRAVAGRGVKMAVRGADAPAPTGGTVGKTKPGKVTSGKVTPTSSVDKPTITDGISSMEQLDVKVAQLYDDLSKLPAANVQKALEIQGNLDELEQYRKKLEAVAASRRALTLQGDMAGIMGNAAGNTQAADLGGMLQGKLPGSLAKLGKVDVVADIELRNTAADELRRQIETVVESVNAGELGAEVGRMLVDGINDQLEGLGKQRRKVRLGLDERGMDKTIGHLTKGMEQFGEVAQAAGQAFGSSEANVAGIIATGIANIVAAFSDAMLKDQTSKTNIWAWIAASAAATAQLLGIIGAVHGATGYATGGIVGGSSYSGDRIPARVNSGEMILTRWQQRRLWDVANGGSVPVGSSVSPRLDTGRLQLQPLRVEVSGRLTGHGRQLVAVIGNEGKARGSAGWRLPW